MTKTRISMEDLIQDFIYMGRDDDYRIPHLLKNNDNPLKVLLNSNSSWNNYIKNREEKELECLIRGLVIYSKFIRKSLGGSVSPVRFIYEVYLAKSPTNEPELTEWVVLNRVNPYEPFGTMKHNYATSYSNFLRIKNDSDLKTKDNVLREATRQKEYQNIRVITDCKLATERIAGAVRRGDLLAVKALLKKGADIDEVEVKLGQPLRNLAIDNGRETVAKYLQSIKLP